MADPNPTTDLVNRAQEAIYHLRNGGEDDPYVIDRSPTIDPADDKDDGETDVRVSDDCGFCTVPPNEGQPMLGTAYAIAGAGKLIADLLAAHQQLAKFKAYVHQRLDDAGVPADPPSAHREQGCRIGGRLDWIIGRQANIRAWQVCDEDVIAAATAEEAIAYHMREMGSDRTDLRDPPDELDLTKTMQREAEDASKGRITYAEAIAECASFPRLLASTEY